MSWDIGVTLVNAYIVYRRVSLKYGVSKSDLLSHHNFRKQVVVAWISPSLYSSTEMNSLALSM